MNQLMYQLPLKDTWLPQVFHVMEKAKADSNGDLEDYSVSQLTLDDVRLLYMKYFKGMKIKTFAISLTNISNTMAFLFRFSSNLQVSKVKMMT